jgi:hypothetical protein
MAAGQYEVLYIVQIDEATGKIVAAVVTTNDVHDGEVLSDLLNQVEAELEQVTTDGAYDHGHCYDEIDQRGATAVIPPRKDAVIWQHGNCKETPHPRDENLLYIRKHGHKKWKKSRITIVTLWLKQLCIEKRYTSHRLVLQPLVLFITQLQKVLYLLIDIC